MTAPATSVWRIAGMTYLQYANRAAGSVRAGLKEPLKSKLAAQGQFSYKVSSWTNGEQSPKIEIDTLDKAGKAV
ncbi:mitochondrial ATP synthase epsilon chain [Nitzschia inconspicua]|uniref:Mitochondrial ATP synthase epsilon chain n=1 Tax=Nitzschia inconspicua TaxID=303405 RepID=A0A9K3LAH6_9STRA|nr:mitochondrial ATP synthase epsilon chain [Nitzschia inconspicua]